MDVDAALAVINEAVLDQQVVRPALDRTVIAVVEGAAVERNVLAGLFGVQLDRHRIRRSHEAPVSIESATLDREVRDPDEPEVVLVARIDLEVDVLDARRRSARVRPGDHADQQGLVAGRRTGKRQRLV